MPRGRPYLRRPKAAPRPRPKTNFLREWREWKDWTQEKLAEESGLSLSSISAYERLTEDGNDPSVDALHKLGKALGIPPGMIIDIDPGKNPGLVAAYMRAVDSQR